MGNVYAFPGPEHTRGPRLVISAPASIIILPVVRVERHPDKPSEGFDQPRRPLRRRRLVPINFCGND